MFVSTEAPRASSSAQPQWIKPSKQVDEPVLKVYNSLTRSKDVFVAAKGYQVDWYNCGPTVYDSSHMGHARNYLTQDIIRRILRDYFGYDVNFVMNVTDIDDKIILRARESFLLSKTIDQNPTLSGELISTAHSAFATYLRNKIVKILPSPLANEDINEPLKCFDAILAQDSNDLAWANKAREKDEKFGLYLTSMSRASSAIRSAEGKRDSQEMGEGAAAVRDLVQEAGDILGPYLGETLADTITNPISICRELASHWEASFFNDMARLHVLPPDTITRVSEYVPEIVRFVERIIENGFAYEGGGSVWFDVEKFESSEGDGFRHEYAKLQPGNKGNKKLLDEGEGALTGSQGKRQVADFALWKAKSKPGEPAWPSPWGEGRPGWHIECSVMASDVLGRGMDIHSGGVDLMFPHHDNELAQSEAYHGCRQWVNYFLHTGHLHIEGLKMSKSLKNFITIDDALNRYSARQLRLAFLLQPWSARMDFKTELIADVKTKEETLDNFFTNIRARIAQTGVRGPSTDGRHHFDGPEKRLMDTLHDAQRGFRAALCDSFNTPAALNVLLDLVSQTNIYFARSTEYNIGVIETIAVWVTRSLKMFGLGEGIAAGANGGIGWGNAGELVAESGDFEAKIDKYLRALSSFRDDVRKLSVEGGSSKDMLVLCDRFRDQDLVNLGVQLDDGQGPGGGALYKLVDPSVLIRQRDERAAAIAEKAARKSTHASAMEAKRIATLEKGRVPPVEMFRPPNVEDGVWSAWDEQGIPTLDGQGKEISKGASKKCLKEWKAQEKAHEAYLAWKEEEGK